MFGEDDPEGILDDLEGVGEDLRNELDELQEEAEHLQGELDNARQDGDVSFIHHMELESVRANKEVADMAGNLVAARGSCLRRTGVTWSLSVPDFMRNIHDSSPGSRLVTHQVGDVSP